MPGSPVCRVGNIDVAPVLNALRQLPEAFEQDRWRRSMSRSPHLDSDVLILRSAPTARPRDVLESLDVVDRDVYEMPEFRDAVLAIAAVAGCPPARALIAKLQPGGAVLPHTDCGAYADATERFHVALETNPESWLEFEGVRAHFEPGEIWHVDKHVPHCGANEGLTPRLHLIVDVWAQ